MFGSAFPHGFHASHFLSSFMCGNTTSCGAVIRIPARNQPISSLRCNYITQATKQVRNADRENNRYCNGNVVEQLHDQLASSIGKGAAFSPNETEISHGRVSWQTRWTHFAMGPLASSIG